MMNRLRRRTQLGCTDVDTFKMSHSLKWTSFSVSVVIVTGAMKANRVRHAR
jgi:hypothetical protein